MTVKEDEVKNIRDILIKNKLWTTVTRFEQLFPEVFEEPEKQGISENGYIKIRFIDGDFEVSNSGNFNKLLAVGALELTKQEYIRCIQMGPIN